jgi:tetratricopeptide (TPR) repeat protein
VREIGRKLGVSHIVEGSVRRDSEQVRVTAQLVRVADGFHLWSDTYDRELKNVFALQDDIAKQVARQLQAKLGVGLPAASTRAAIEPAAYDEYLRGRALHRQRKDLPAAIAHFKAAVAQAPEFAAAWASLSLAYEVTFWYTENRTPEYQAALLAGELAAAERAAALEPDAATTQHALGNLARAQFKYALAEEHYLRAMQIDPGYSDVREDYAELLLEVGRVRDSAVAARQLVKLDPYLGVGWIRIWDAAAAMDSRPDVEEALHQLLTINPNNDVAKSGALDYALCRGRAEEARAALVEIEARWPAADTFYMRVLLPWALGDPAAEAGRVSEALLRAPAGQGAFYLVARQDVAGYDNYMRSSGPIIQARSFSDLQRSGPRGQAMLRDPRIKSSLTTYGFPAYWREKGWPSGCRPVGETDFECGLNSADGK